MCNSKEGDVDGRMVVAVARNGCEQVKVSDALDSPRALAWDEAERTKYMARYKREEVKIQAWEDRENRKAEIEKKRMEVKAERMKSRAEEKLAIKLAATRRRAEEKRATAGAKLNKQAAITAEKGDYIQRTGHLPIKLPSLCGKLTVIFFRLTLKSFFSVPNSLPSPSVCFLCSAVL